MLLDHVRLRLVSGADSVGRCRNGSILHGRNCNVLVHKFAAYTVTIWVHTCSRLTVSIWFRRVMFRRWAVTETVTGCNEV